MFWIGFTDEQFLEAEPGEEGRVGLLVLGNHKERFVVHFWTWSEEQYVAHWRKALQRAMNGQPSALVTDMATPAQSSHLVWWPMWKTNSELVLHNQLLFFAKYKVAGTNISLDHLYDLIGEQKSHNDEGIPLSEWRVAVSDVEAFLKSNHSGGDWGTEDRRDVP
ncbi:MAG TPA: hypothetical protein VIL63_12180 [Terriglobales bacterium]